MPPKPSKWTVHRILRDLGMDSRYLKFKPLLSKVHRRRRHVFSKKKIKAYNIAQWRNVVSSDEKLLRVKVLKRVRVWVPKKANLLAAQYVVSSVACRTRVMVWGAINSSGTLIVRRCPPKIDSVAYQAILKSVKSFRNPRFF